MVNSINNSFSPSFNINEEQKKYNKSEHVDNKPVDNESIDDSSHVRTLPTLPSQASSTAVDVHNQILNGNVPPSPSHPDNSSSFPKETSSSTLDLSVPSQSSSKPGRRKLKQFGNYI